MAAVLKTVDRKVRGFESCSLRQKTITSGNFLPSCSKIERQQSGEMAEWSKAIAC
jgi:hypothetical protein